MSVTHSALTHELSFGHVRSVAAIIYANEVYPDAIFKTALNRCRALGTVARRRLAASGLRQWRPACDVVLEDLATGHRTALFENRGSGARGCRLDQAALAEATAMVERKHRECSAASRPQQVRKGRVRGRRVARSDRERHRPWNPGHYWCSRNKPRRMANFAGEFSTELPDAAAEVTKWLEEIVAGLPVE